jgi:iron complex outermembrane receptor protein
VQATSTPLGDALPDLHLTGNLRVDYLRYGAIDFPLQPSFRLGVVYQWSEGVVTKLVGGRAFQTPSGVLMFAKPGYGRANNVIGNADLTPLGFAPLRPQTVTGAEAILSLRLFDGGLELDAGIYAQEVGDPIQFQQIATDFIAVNADNTRNIGGVLSLRAQVERLSGYATLSVQREILDGEIVRSPPSQYPNHFGTAGLTLRVPEARLVLNTHLRWATRRGATQSNVLLNNQERYTLPAYAVLDLTASTAGLYLIGDNRSETRFSFSVRDVLDTQYSEPGFGGFDIPSLGRTFWIEIRQMFL